MYSKVVCINAGGRKFQTSLQTLLKFPDTRFAHLFSSAIPCSSNSFIRKEVSRSCRGNSKEVPELPSTSLSPPPGSSSSSSLSSTLEGSVGGVEKKEGSHFEATKTDSDEFFLDVCPKVFERTLNFLRTKVLFLPTDDIALRGDLVHQLREWDLLDKAFPPTGADSSKSFMLNASDRDRGHPFTGTKAGEESEEVEAHLSLAHPLPDVCTVQLLDSMSIDAGVRRHALTITFGSDGFQLRELAKRIRRDLRDLLSATYWQVHQTGERSVFFATTRVADGAAALLTTSILQQVIRHTETMGYGLTSTSSTISPDPVHVSVRLFLQQLVFRRSRLHLLEPGDMVDEEERRALLQSYTAEERNGAAAQEEEDVEETFDNFEPRHVGPKKTIWSPYNGEGGSARNTPRLPDERERCGDFFGSSEEASRASRKK